MAVFDVVPPPPSTAEDEAEHSFKRETTPPLVPRGLNPSSSSSSIPSLIGLRVLDLRGASLLRLPPLDACASTLESAIFDGNRLVTLSSLTFLPRLRELSARSNSLLHADLLLQQCPRLLRLHLSENNLVSSSVSRMGSSSSLLELDLSCNCIDRLADVSICSSLLRLNLSSNDIAELNAASSLLPPSLEHLDLSSTQIVDPKQLANLSGLHALRSLDVQGSPFLLYRTPLVALPSENEGGGGGGGGGGKGGVASGRMVALTLLPLLRLLDGKGVERIRKEEQRATKEAEAERRRIKTRARMHKMSSSSSSSRTTEKRKKEDEKTTRKKKSQIHPPLGWKGSLAWVAEAEDDAFSWQHSRSGKERSRRRSFPPLDTLGRLKNAKIRAYVRGWQVRVRLALYKRRVRAALDIQAAWRGLTARRRLGLSRGPCGGKSTMASALVEERMMQWKNRHHQLEGEVREERRMRSVLEEAISVLWAEVAGLRKQTEVLFVEKKNKAAATIQAAWRGYSCRRRYFGHRKLWKEVGMRKAAAVVVIQRHARRWIKAHYAVKVKAAVVLQKRTRGWLARQRTATMLQIQSLAREVLRLRREVIALKEGQEMAHTPTSTPLRRHVHEGRDSDDEAMNR